MQYLLVQYHQSASLVPPRRQRHMVISVVEDVLCDHHATSQFIHKSLSLFVYEDASTSSQCFLLYTHKYTYTNIKCHWRWDNEEYICVSYKLVHFYISTQSISHSTHSLIKSHAYRSKDFGYVGRIGGIYQSSRVNLHLVHVNKLCTYLRYGYGVKKCYASRKENDKQ